VTGNLLHHAVTKSKTAKPVAREDRPIGGERSLWPDVELTAQHVIEGFSGRPNFPEPVDFTV